ncbi:hypothetical protein LTS18_001282, partial [Coniosporium uncinatum]
MARNKGRSIKGGYKAPGGGGGAGSSSSGPPASSASSSQATKKPPLTHFLCIPLVTAASRPQLDASFAKFRADVLSAGPPAVTTTAREEGAELEGAELEGAELEGAELEGGDVGSAAGGRGEKGKATGERIAEKAVRPVGALHLTLGVMSLRTPEMCEGALGLLEGLDVGKLLGEVGKEGGLKDS